MINSVYCVKFNVYRSKTCIILYIVVECFCLQDLLFQSFPTKELYLEPNQINVIVENEIYIKMEIWVLYYELNHISCIFLSVKAYKIMNDKFLDLVQKFVKFG